MTQVLIRLPALLTLICSTSCGGVNVGPRIETKFVIVRAGHPLEILESEPATVRRLDDDQIGRLDLDGWIAMPREHFDALMRALPKEPP